MGSEGSTKAEEANWPEEMERITSGTTPATTREGWGEGTTRRVAAFIHSAHHLPEETKEGLRTSVAELELHREGQTVSPVGLRGDVEGEVVATEERLVERLVADAHQRYILQLTASVRESPSHRRCWWGCPP